VAPHQTRLLSGLTNSGNFFTHLDIDPEKPFNKKEVIMIKFRINREYGLINVLSSAVVLFFIFLVPSGGYSTDSDADLIQAVRDENIEAVNFLIGKGANVNAKDEHLHTPLIIAAKSGQIECVKMLLANGAYIDSQCIRKCSALIWSVDSGHNDVAILLIRNGAALNTQDAEGWTALMTAVYRRNSEIVHALVNNGANLHAKNVGGLSALKLAEEHKVQPEIIATLKKAGAK
jgi:ankyrin repeat protein